MNDIINWASQYLSAEHIEMLVTVITIQFIAFGFSIFGWFFGRVR